MVKLNEILKFFADRVEKFGAPYQIFAFFGLINYPMTYFVRVYLQKDPDSESLFLRGLATFLCLGLFIKDYWPQKVKKFLPIYWYTTVTVSLPVIIVYSLLKNNFSLGWLVNSAVGLLITILIVDWFMCLFSVLTAIIIGYIIFTLQYGFMTFHVDSDNIHMALYLYAMIFTFCLLFAKSKETFNLTVSEKVRKKSVEEMDELKKNLATKATFLNKISHEIRGGTQIICVLADSLLKKWKKYPDNKKEQVTTQIGENTKRLFELVNDWIDISILSQKNLNLHTEPFDLLSVVTESVKNAKVLGKQKDIKISLIKDSSQKDQDYTTVFNKDRINQVIYNIFINAIKFSPKSSSITANVFPHVLNLENGESTSGFCVAIRDEGPGIPEESFGVIFDSFMQEQREVVPGSVKGLGLGLSLAKEIVNKHNGKIWAENNENQGGGAGSTFTFFLPLKFKPYSLVEKKGAKKAKVKTNLKVLFLDDEALCCAAGKLVLLSLGHSVTTFTDVDKLFDCLEGKFNNIDLIFIDIMMPVSGTAVIKRLKSNKKFRDIPIIAQSGIIEDALLKELSSFKGVGFVSKPYGRTTVKIEINRLMG